MNKDYIVKLKKEYEFEGKKFKEINLSGLEDLNARDLTKAEKIFASGGNIAPVNEMAIGYICIIAAEVTDKPIDFYENMKAKDIISIKNIIADFLLN